MYESSRKKGEVLGDARSIAFGSLSSDLSGLENTSVDYSRRLDNDPPQPSRFVAIAFPIEDLPTELLANIFIYLDGITQHVLRRVNRRWNAVLRSFPVTRFTTIVDLKEPNSPEARWTQKPEYSKKASPETMNLIIRTVNHILCPPVDKTKLNDYWPNLRTLSLCNGRINPMEFWPEYDWVNREPGIRNGRQEYHFHPLGYLVTLNMRWIVLRNVDISGIARNTIVCQTTGQALDITSAPNPYNGGRNIFSVNLTGRRRTVVTIGQKYFNISFHESSKVEFLDILDQECKPATGKERTDLLERINSFSCPYFDKDRKALTDYLARLEPGFKGVSWEEALSRIDELKHISFRCFQSIIYDIMQPLHTEPNPFFCCSELVTAFHERCSAEGGCGPTTYANAVTDHYETLRTLWREWARNPSLEAWIV